MQETSTVSNTSVNPWVAYVKETGTDFLKNTAPSLLFASVIGFNPLGALAYSSSTYIIGKVTERVFKKLDYRYEQKRLNQRKFWICTSINMIALYAKFGFVPQMAFTLIGIQNLTEWIVRIYQTVRYDLKNYRTLLDWHNFELPYMTSEDMRTLLFQGVTFSMLSYGISKVCGLNPIFALVTTVQTVFWNQLLSMLVDSKLRGRSSFIPIQQVVAFGVVAGLGYNSYGLSLAASVGFLGVRCLSQNAMRLLPHTIFK